MGIMELNMIDRDPNNINAHLQVMWDDVVGEPEGIRSMDFIWKCSHTCFSFTKDYCYKILSCLMAPCLAFAMGCQFACLAFQHIWFLGPSLRCYKINCAALRNFMMVGLTACCAPYYETVGLLFSKIKIRHQKVADVEEETNILHV